MYLKGSLTVEGAGVISISMIIIGMCILLAFSIYKESIDYLSAVTVRDIKVVESFRQIRAGKTIIEELGN